MGKLKLPLVTYCGIDYGHRIWSTHLVKCETCKAKHNELKLSWDKLCLCGCGELTTYGCDFIRGHVMRHHRTDKQIEIFDNYLRSDKNPQKQEKNKKYGDSNMAKKPEIRVKISENNPMKNPEYFKKATENRKKVGYTKTILLNKTLWDDKTLLEKRIKTYCQNLADGKIELKNNWKVGYYTRKDGTKQWFDSSYEEKRMSYYDTNNINWTKKHGITISYVNEDGLNSYYVPDFLIEINGVKSIEEIKGWIKKNDVLKAEAGIKYCETLGYNYTFLLGKDSIKQNDLSYAHI